MRKPQGLAFDANGDLLIADTDNHDIVIYDTTTLTTSIYAGSSSGLTNGAVTSARFRNPVGIAVDTNGDIYVADTGNHAIRKISNSVVSTYAGFGGSGFVDGSKLSSSFSSPAYLTFDDSGDLLVTDRTNNRVRKISSSDQKVYTLAGDGTRSLFDSRVTEAKLGFLGGIVLNDDGDILVADHSSDRLRLISDFETFSENLGIPDPTDPETIEVPVTVPVAGNTAPVVDLLNFINFDDNKRFLLLKELI